jgi:acyl dehydratase
MAGQVPAAPAAIESARFLSPVFPGDQVVVEAKIAPASDGWICSVRLTVAGTACALVRLRYRR